MKRLLLSTLLAASPLICAAQYGGGFTLQVGDPNFYGQINIDDGPPPQVLYSYPVVAIPTGEYYPPVYLRVPPLYYQNWSQYCGYYNACYRPVYFVQEGWYSRFYRPYYRNQYRSWPGYVPHHHYYYRGWHDSYENRYGGRR